MVRPVQSILDANRFAGTPSKMGSAATVPLNRVGDPRDRPAIMFLASARRRFILVRSYVVDGGKSAR